MKSTNESERLTLVMILFNELTRTKWKVEGAEEARQTFKEETVRFNFKKAVLSHKH